MIDLPHPARVLPARVRRHVTPAFMLAWLLCALWLPSQPPSQDLVLSFGGLLACCLLFAAVERVLARNWRLVGSLLLALLTMLAVAVAARLSWQGLALPA